MFFNYNMSKENLGTPLCFPSILGFKKEKKLKSTIEKNTKKLKEEYTNKIEDYFLNSSFGFINKNENVELLKKTKEEIVKIAKDNIKESTTTKIIQKEGSGECIAIFFYLISFLLSALIFYKLFEGTKLHKEKYESVSEFNIELLDKIKTNEDLEKLDIKTIDYLYLRLFHFADLPYYFRNKIKEKIFLNRFKDWEIINDNIIGKDNCFYVFKNKKYKKLIVSFPGTNIASTQLLEEIFGSAFKNFHKDYKDVFISKYFGERISQLLNVIFNPEIKKLFENKYQIISTGHSLGGAISQAFIYFALVENKINNTNSPMTITFNQPKVGNRLFSEFLDKNSINLRFTKGSDIVSSIPFSSFEIKGMFNYIIKNRNIYNEYIHTKISINISDTDSWNVPSYIKIIFLLLFFFAFLLYLSNLTKFVYNLPINSKILVIIINIIYFIIGVINFIIVIFFFNILLKYNAFISYIFLFIISIILSIFMHLIFCELFLLVFLIYDIMVFIYNIYPKIYQLIEYQNSVEIDLEKFKKASGEEKVSIMSSFIILLGTVLGGRVAIEDILSHMKTNQKTGKEEYSLNVETSDNKERDQLFTRKFAPIDEEQTFDSIVESIGKVDKIEDIGFKYLLKIDKYNKRTYNSELVYIK